MTPADTITDTTAIERLLAIYERSLNEADAAAAAALYAPDGVFLPYNLPTAAGKNIQSSYEAIFNTIHLDIAFTVQDVRVDGDLAFATTGSKGHVTVIIENLTIPEENRELFVFARVDGQWKIARYMFNKSASVAA